MEIQDTARPARRKLRAICSTLGLIALAIALVAFWQSRQTSRHFEDIRKAGYPATLAELNQWYLPVPDAENAALKILEACSHLVPLSTPITGHSPLPPEEKDLLNRLLTNNRTALKLAHDAANLTKSRFPVDLNQGLNTLLPHLAQTKQLVTQLRDVAILHSEEGRPELALQTYTDALAVSRSLAQEPVLISQLVRVACLAVAQTALKEILTRRELTDAHLKEISIQLRDAEALGQSGITRALAGERCMGIDLFQSNPRRVAAVLGATASTNVMTVFLGLRSLIGLRHIDFFHYRQFMRTWLETSQLPFPQCLEESKDAFRRYQSGETPLKRFVHPMTSMLLPALERTMAKEAASCARLRAAQTALAIERFRIQHDSLLPETLSALTPTFLASVPKDPFDGRPLRYKKLNEGYVVYSVGDDGKDDGGKPAIDVTFSVGR